VDVLVVGIAVVPLIVAAGAAFANVKAWLLMDEVQDRTDAHDQLIWLQTALNQFERIQQARAADEERAYIDHQRWLRTCLTRLGPTGDTLTATSALAGRPYDAGWAGMVEAVTEAWEEVHAALDEAATEYRAVVDRPRASLGRLVPRRVRRSLRGALG
jgi:hypothetical protein